MDGQFLSHMRQVISAIEAADFESNIENLGAYSSDTLAGLMRLLDGMEDRVFILRGRVLAVVEDHGLWGEGSFDKWLRSVSPKSYSTARKALAVIRALPDIPMADLARMPRCNLEQLRSVSSHVRVLPEVVEAAKTLHEKEFVALANEGYSQHLEMKQPVIMASSEDCEEFNAAIQRAMERGAPTRGEAIKDISVNYLLDYPAEQSA